MRLQGLICRMVKWAERSLHNRYFVIHLRSPWAMEAAMGHRLSGRLSFADALVKQRAGVNATLWISRANRWAVSV